jgi:hypothetical protein
LLALNGKDMVFVIISNLALFYSLIFYAAGQSKRMTPFPRKAGETLQTQPN